MGLRSLASSAQRLRAKKSNEERREKYRAGCDHYKQDITDAGVHADGDVHFDAAAYLEAHLMLDTLVRSSLSPADHDGQKQKRLAKRAQEY